MKYGKIKKVLALIIAGTLLCGVPVAAADTGQGGEYTSVAAGVPGETEEEADFVQDGEETDFVQDENEVDSVSDVDKADPAQDENATDPAQGGEEGTSAQDEEEFVSSQDEADPDVRTAALLAEYEKWLAKKETRGSAGSYSSELAKFPSDYQTLLKQLHAKHPNWVFVAVQTGLDWGEVVREESVSGPSTGTNRSLLPNSSFGLLLSKAKTDYNTSTGKYIPKDGSTWVSASKPAVAFYADPRNFLTDEYIFMFEALDYNDGYHTKAGVEAVLKGTDLENKKISYLNTKGQTVSTDLTYGETILAAGAKKNVSPLFLAAKIKQETGAKLSHGSISGNFSYNGTSFRGYYNYYNIGATSTSTGSPIANGLNYAKGGSTGAVSYSRPWTSPALSITGGAEFIAKTYISKGQNTIYFERFNTVTAPYYQHQYMQNLTGAASEARTTYNSYKSMGIVDDSYVFYIPVYKNMPSRSSTVNISKSVKTGKTTSNVTMRKGPSTSYASLGVIPGGTSVTASGAVYTDVSTQVYTQQAHPYWFKVTYGGKTGYISANYFQAGKDSSIKAGSTKQLSVKSSGSGEAIYYETSDPAVATVNASGKVTAVKKGSCMIYAVTESGRAADVIGIEVTAASSGSTGGTSSGSGGNTSSGSNGTSGTTAVKLATPPLKSATGSTSAVKVTWGKVSGAEGYYVYRKVSGGKWSKIATVKGNSKISYSDKKAVSGKTYYYTVRAYKGKTLSSYVKSGIKGKRIAVQKYKVKTTVNYRSGAGTKYSVKGKLAKGRTISVEKGYSKKANGYTWYRFFINGKSYYVASKYLKKI